MHNDTTGNPRNILRLCMGTRGTSAIISLCGCALLFLFRYDKDPNFRIITRKTQQEITRNSEIGWNFSKTRRNQYTRIQVRVLILGYRGHPIQTLIIRRSLGVPVVVSRRQRTDSDPETQNFPFRKPKTFQKIQSQSCAIVKSSGGPLDTEDCSIGQSAVVCRRTKSSEFFTFSYRAWLWNWLKARRDCAPRDTCDSSFLLIKASSDVSNTTSWVGGKVLRQYNNAIDN